MQFLYISDQQQHYSHNDIHPAPYSHMGVPCPVSGVSYLVPVAIIPNMFHRGDRSGVFLPPPDGPINASSNLNTILQPASSAVRTMERIDSSMVQMNEQPYKVDLENAGQVSALELDSVKEENKDPITAKVDNVTERDKSCTNEKNLTIYHEENIIKTENEPGRQTGQADRDNVINTMNLLSADDHVKSPSGVTKSEIHVEAEIVELGHTDKVENKVPSHYREENAGKKTINCQVCGKSFSKKYNLRVHSRTHTGEKPFSCEVCGKSFTTKDVLIKHNRIHTGEKPFSCEVCGKSFAQKQDLIEHNKIHTGEKPFSCQVCGKSFTRKPYLIMHNRVHTGEKPFSCQVCGKSFVKKGNLNAHHRTHTGE